ncbi:MAG: N-acetylmuramoyl-L-alanine amidase [Bacteroidota bacterium]
MFAIIKALMLKKYKLLFSFLMLIMLIGAFKIPKQDPKRKIKIVVIDPGHGGKDPGCSGLHHNEKTVALSVGLKLGKYIEENIKDVKVIYTRKTDVFVDLEDRAKIANDYKADLFISIHCNAAGKPVMIKDKKTGKLRAKTFKNSKGKYIVVETVRTEPYGSETYVMGLKNEEGKMKVAQRENSVILLEDNYQSKYEGFDPDSYESYIIMSNYTSAYVAQSASLAIKIQDEYSNKAGRLDKGVHRQSLWVLWRTSMPSVLTEIGYLTNPKEEKFLGSEKGQEYIASCLFRAFRKYKDEIEGAKKIYNDAFENQKPLEKDFEIIPNDSNDVLKEIVDTVSLQDQKEILSKKESEKKEKEDSIALVNALKLKNEKMEKDQKEKKYKQLIALADLNFKKKSYEVSRSFYNQAINLNVIEEKHPFNRLITIDSILTAMSVKKNKIVTTDSIKIEPKTISNSGIIFKIQFASSDKALDKSKYNHVSELWEYKMGNVYKYTSGNFKKFEDAIKHQSQLKALGYNDCFVAAFNDGVRMDIIKAKKLTETK